jgi:hypothetical protein
MYQARKGISVCIDLDLFIEVHVPSQESDQCVYRSWPFYSLSWLGTCTSIKRARSIHTLITFLAWYMYFNKKGKVTIHESELPCIYVLGATSQENERPCICVLGVTSQESDIHGRTLSWLVTPNTQIHGYSLSWLVTPSTHIHGRSLSWLDSPSTHIHGRS